MKITFIKVTPLIWAIEGQNNESFNTKVSPLIWDIECQNNESLILISITGGDKAVMENSITLIFFLNEAFPKIIIPNNIAQGCE